MTPRPESGTMAVLAEKPSVARDIARVLGASQRGTATCTAAATSSPGPSATWWRWPSPTRSIPPGASGGATPLPMLPAEWPLVVYEKTRDQFEVVRKILNSPRVSRIVCATDAGREGELIFRYIYEAAGCAKPVSRLWISSLTPDAIRKGFDALQARRRLRPAGRRRPRPQPRRLAGGHEPLARLHAGLRRGPLGGPRADADARHAGGARARHPQFVPEDYLEVRRRSIPVGDAEGEHVPGHLVPRTEAGRRQESLAAKHAPARRRGGGRRIVGARAHRRGRHRVGRSRRPSACRRRCSTTSPSCSGTPTASTASARRGRSTSRRRSTSATSSSAIRAPTAATSRRTWRRPCRASSQAIEAPYREHLAPGTGERPLGAALRRRRQGHRPPRHHPHRDLAREGVAHARRAQDLRPDLPPPAQAWHDDHI